MVGGKRKVAFFAVNDIGCSLEQELRFWATLHPEKLGDWRGRRKPPLNQDYLAISHREEHGADLGITIPEQWGGSSGLYAIQCGLQFGYSRIIACGMPLDARPHFFDPKEWKDCYSYRDGWTKHVSHLKPRVRSMSGWTMTLLGKPTPQWINGEPE